VKRKLFRLTSPFGQLSSSPPKMKPSVSKIDVKVFVRPSHRPWNAMAPQPSRLARQSSLKVFPRNSAKIARRGPDCRRERGFEGEISL
jgi:hypothetical protein